MEQTLRKRRLIQLIILGIFFLIFALHDCLIVGQFFLDSIDAPRAWEQYSSFVICIEGLITLAAIFLTIYANRNATLILCCINILIALLPIILIELSLKTIYYLIFILISAILITYTFTRTKPAWEKGSRIIFILAIASFCITLYLSCFYYNSYSNIIIKQMAISDTTFSTSNWERFGNSFGSYIPSVYPKWWGIHYDLYPLVNYGLVQTLASFYPLSIGILFLALAAGLNFNHPKPVKQIAKSNSSISYTRCDGYIGLTKHILLSLFTFGIWPLVWTYRTTQKLNEAPNVEQYNPANKLLLCIFVPFYQIYRYYKHGQRLDALASEKKLNASDMATLCLILGIFIPLVASILMQDRINQICTVQASIPKSTPEDATEDVQEPMQKSASKTVPIHSEADELKKYKELLDMGAISQEEYDAKKKQLLGL